MWSSTYKHHHSRVYPLDSALFQTCYTL
ncbi:Protein of unknown function [Pyronema omphalodes CBS 100304]|uniref:Uncharacterized protein n=1 Tax=Pyronema omphalodes (strain CBS 100304) TaxID=1076935 RepID=U4KZY7_PYROM|nr:Protein of unknown function [Pyronema omphalodes CBS 100304]